MIRKSKKSKYVDNDYFKELRKIIDINNITRFRKQIYDIFYLVFDKIYTVYLHDIFLDKSKRILFYIFRSFTLSFICSNSAFAIMKSICFRKVELRRYVKVLHIYIKYCL